MFERKFRWIVCHILKLSFPVDHRQECPLPRKPREFVLVNVIESYGLTLDLSWRLEHVGSVPPARRADCVCWRRVCKLTRPQNA